MNDEYIRSTVSSTVLGTLSVLIQFIQQGLTILTSVLPSFTHVKSI